MRVVVGDEVHVSLLKALALLGLGRERVERVPVDGQGRMRADALPALDDRTIVCLQAGNVNTGAFDPRGGDRRRVPRPQAPGFTSTAPSASGRAAAPSLAPLAAGLDGADSWATDAHKWLNVPYDSGLVFCRDAARIAPRCARAPPRT